MNPLLTHQLLFVTGKGGVGKTTVALALALEAAAQGRRTILCEVGKQRRAADLLGVAPGLDGAEIPLAPGLWGTSIDPRFALEEWLGTQIGRSLTQVLARSGGFQYFVAASPGTDELVTMTKIWELTQPKRWDKKHPEHYDLVVVDAPASGHGLAMLAAPGTFATVARVGPIATQARNVHDLLADPGRSAFLAVALAAELPVTETIELSGQLEAGLGRPLDAIVANQMLPRRFTGADLRAIDRHAARPFARAARSHASGVSAQQGQLRRLRAGVGVPVSTLPLLVRERLTGQDARDLGHALGRTFTASGAAGG